MDMAGKDANAEPQKGSEDPPVNYNAPSLSSNWQLNGSNLMGNSMVESSACSSAPMVDSPFCPPAIWDQPINGQGLSYCDMNIPNDATTSSSIRAGMGNWTPNPMLRGGPVFLPSTLPGMLPQNLPHFPADSAFVERAARFSCFSGGNFGEMMNPFSVLDPLNPYSWGLGQMQEVFGAKQIMQPQRNEMNVMEVSKEASSLPGNERIPLKKSESFLHSHEEGKRGGVEGSGNESEEAEFSGRGAQEDLDRESSGKGLGSKKRKRAGQAMEPEGTNDTPQQSVETAKNTSEIKEKGDEKPTSSGKKHGKQGSQGSDQPKEEYIHVRARRGQATNSHSLAERVRREKISERMKFLQDLVPGCNKVTGKAVMLDEIINYVQSLQRQVEFLSMKLATVNPRLEFNIEGFLNKDILQPRAGLSSSLAFPSDMTMPFPQLLPSQTGLIPAGHPAMGNSSDTLRRPINLQSAAACGGFKEATSQVPGVWEDELHNVVHMGFNPSAALNNNNQDLSGSLPTGQMKAEP